MFKTFSAAAIAISLIAGPALAQGNTPVTEPAKVAQTAKPVVHKPVAHKASLHRSHRHVAHRHAAHRHVAHIKKAPKHIAHHGKPAKPAKTVKRIKQDKINTAG